MEAYPEEIIPRHFFKKKLNLDYIRQRYGDFYVCRRMESPMENYVSDLVDGTRILDVEECLGANFFRMSMNLMGASYNESHLRYHITKEASADWSGAQVSAEDFPEEMRKNEGVGYPLYYSSKSLHRRIFPHSHQGVKKDQHSSMAKYITEIALDKIKQYPIDISVHYELFVNHVPTNLNYWHVQLEVKPAGQNDSEIFTKAPGWLRRMYTHSVFDILEKEFVESPDITLLPARCLSCSLEYHCSQRFER